MSAFRTSALPSPTARALAVAAIVVAGLCGGLIGWAVADLQCGADPSGPPAPGTARSQSPPDDGGCGTVAGLGALVGSVIGAAGVAVITVLVLRAMAEWRRQLPLEEDVAPSPPQRWKRSRRKPSA